MSNAHGDFIWYELLTPDPAGTKAFYEKILPWTVDVRGDKMPNGSEYRMITVKDGQQAGGVLTLTDAMASGGAKPGWFGYVAVADVDDAVARVRARGGQVHMEPMDMEGIGRMALVADPFGAPLYVMRGFSDEESTAYRPMQVGHAAWNEITTPDFDSARQFYFDLFGWTDGEDVPMGEADDMGRYRMFDQQGRSIGGIFEPAGEYSGMPPAWLYYFMVEDIDAAYDSIRANGGTPMHEPQPIPGDMFTMAFTDPQGAMCAVVGNRKG